MIQFLADQLDQLDLALDQLALKDRNFDRFALVLIDNVIELTLHQHAQDISLDAQMYPPDDGSRYDPKLVAEALGPYFDAKVRLASTAGLVDGELSETLKYLHGFRNAAYHRGARHEGILHALALLYARTACQVMQQYQPMFWSSSSRDGISHRAVKYLGAFSAVSPMTAFKQAWRRLADVTAHHGDTLVTDLTTDAIATIEQADEQLAFMADYPQPGSASRDQVMIACQVWPTASSVQGEQYAAAHGGPAPNTPTYIAWIEQHYPWKQRTDPIPSWRRRAAALATEKSPHVALKKYCEFMQQTETLRAQIDTAAGQLDSYIQSQVDSYILEQRGIL